MSVEFLKTGVIKSGGNINENLVTWGYSRNPYIPNTAGNTILSVTVYDDFTRYTATTAGSDGGKYGYPCGSTLVKDTVYTWSCEIRCSIPLSYSSSSRARIGFEGGGMISGADVTIGTDWTRLSKTWTQTTSQAFVNYPSGMLPDGEWMDIRNLKVEIGNIATPFVPPSNEPIYLSNYHGFIETTPPHSKNIQRVYRNGRIHRVLKNTSERGCFN